MNIISDVIRCSSYRMRIRNNAVRDEAAETMGMMVRTLWFYGLSREELEEELRETAKSYNASFSLSFPNPDDDSPEFYLNIFSASSEAADSTCLPSTD